MKYYSLDNILKEEATYNIIIGGACSGKSYATYLHALEYAWVYYKQFALISRFSYEVNRTQAKHKFDAYIYNGAIAKLTEGIWSGVKYKRGCWYWARKNNRGNTEISDKPFAFALSIHTIDRYKLSSYPDVDIIIFDDFISEDLYLPNECFLFFTLLSRIIRSREGVKIFMLGNPSDKECPYFDFMSLDNISKMKKGDIDKYSICKTTVAVEFTDC